MMLFLVSRLQASAMAIGNLLFFLFGLGKRARIADSHGTSEAVGEFDLGVRPILLMLPNRPYQTATCRELRCLSIVAESCGGFCTFMQTNPFHYNDGAEQIPIDGAETLMEAIETRTRGTMWPR